MFDAIWRDVRHALRSLRRTPGFTAAAILSLTLGIGANVAIVTLLDAVLLKPLPVGTAGALVALYETAAKGSPDTRGDTGQLLVSSYPRFQRLQEALGSRGALAATTRSTRLTVRTPQRPQMETAQAQLVSGNYFSVLGASIIDGRSLTADDARADRHSAVAIVSAAFANRRLGGVEKAVGQALIVNDLRVSVIGVAAQGFGGAWTDSVADLWLPLSLQQDLRYRTNVSSYANADRDQPWMSQDRIAWLTIIARIPPALLPQARAILQSTNQGGLVDLAAAFEDEESRQEIRQHRLAVEPLSRGFSGLRERFGDALLALAAMVGIVLLLTCANLTNLLLARANGRWQEIAVRTALGATRWALFRQCLIESLLLAAAGGLAGLMVGQWGSQLLASDVLNTQRDLLPPAFTIDRRMLSFAALATGTAVLLFGVFPAWRATRADARVGLAANVRSGALPVSVLRSMRPLVIAQLTMSFVLVMAAGLFARTLVSFAHVDIGFNPHGVIEVTLDPVLSGYTREQMPALSDRVLAAVRTVPGVVSAAFSFCSLGANCTSSFRIPASGGAPEQRVPVHNSLVGPGYFAMLGARRLSGREFTDRDTASSPRIAVISESLARQFFPGQEAVGKRVGYQQYDVEIVGVVGDVRGADLRQAPAPVLYVPMAQPPAFLVPASNLDIRVSGDAGRAALAIRDAIRRAEPGLFVDRIQALDERLGRAPLRERLVAYLSWAFGALALFLACVGLYGVLSYSVAERTRELGIRTALGARPDVLARMILREAAYIVVPGVVIGGVAARFAGGLVKSLLFGVTAFDPSMYIAVIGVLAAVAVGATFAPARRAARLDPIRALRME
jgi:predicted permease